jgi:hypothetical protein
MWEYFRVKTAAGKNSEKRNGSAAASTVESLGGSRLRIPETTERNFNDETNRIASLVITPKGDAVAAQGPILAGQCEPGSLIS